MSNQSYLTADRCCQRLYRQLHPTSFYHEGGLYCRSQLLVMFPARNRPVLTTQTD